MKQFKLSDIGYQSSKDLGFVTPAVISEGCNCPLQNYAPSSPFGLSHHWTPQRKTERNSNYV